MSNIMTSAIFGAGWASPDLAELFGDTGFVRGWLNIMAVLAETQAEFELIPEEAARGINQAMDTVEFDEAFFAEVEKGYRETNHSLLGLIRAVQKFCPGDSGEWLCYGATVQDISDTRTVLVLLHIRKKLLEHFENIIHQLRHLSISYRDTLMCGRTHGQPGLAITFGFKTAGWLDEFNRHHQRMMEMEHRLAVGQLAGGVGSLSSFGIHAPKLQEAFLKKLGLNSPGISWTSSRDRFAEWINLLALIASTCDRIGQEVYNLQRPEIDELREGFTPGTVGSITMPQKCNPELSEHIGTLARVVRHAAAHLNEALVHDHERDGRCWKAEWVVLPEACLAAEKSISLTYQLLHNLTVNSSRMLENLDASKGFVFAEAVMLRIAPIIGKQSAHTLVYELAIDAKQKNCGFKDAVISSKEIGQLLSHEQIERIFDRDFLAGSCGIMVDRIVDELDRFS